MDWRTAVSTFGLVFIAEMGDKTQLAAISMVSKTRAPWSVLLGSCVALCLVSAVGVFAGAALVRVVPEELLSRVAALAFIAIGILMLWGKL
jgi:putative Ca2+/H+ antiporter (TMEM165/GDT1 family)